jgi:hypothetical protein
MPALIAATATVPEARVEIVAASMTHEPRDKPDE